MILVKKNFMTYTLVKKYIPITVKKTELRTFNISTLGPYSSGPACLRKKSSLAIERAYYLKLYSAPFKIFSLAVNGNSLR